ncbi:MAG: hypothetical protein U0228_03520 [Myxococcaceae bacterium]
MRLVLQALALTCLVGCAPVIGDACTVNTECGKGVCIQAAFAPGGLCSLNCTSTGGTCPAGSTCVTHVIDADTAGCLLSCTKDQDCRTGYVCRVERDSQTKVCVGTSGVP